MISLGFCVFGALIAIIPGASSGSCVPSCPPFYLGLSFTCLLSGFLFVISGCLAACDPMLKIMVRSGAWSRYELQYGCSL